MERPCPTGMCEALDQSRERHEAQIEQLRQGQEQLRLALATESAARDAADSRVSGAAHSRMSKLEDRVQDCESVTKPWRNALINLGTAAVIAAFAWAKAKGWV